MKKIATIVVFTFLIFLCGCNENNPITEFSTENWYEVEWKQRYHMLEDLYEEVDLVGMSAAQIEELLKNDFWMNSGEALKYGIVDKIIKKES